MVGGQDCHAKASGAHTGDISAEMLKDAGASAVIVGHSERRADHGETDAVVRAKAEAAYRAGLTAIVCVGETADERKAGKTLASWSTAQLGISLPDARDGRQHGRRLRAGVGHRHRIDADSGRRGRGARRRARGAGEAIWGSRASGMRILYGGSVKPSNARELMSVENVNGALVGGASLKAEDFLGIIAAYSVKPPRRSRLRATLPPWTSLSCGRSRMKGYNLVRRCLAAIAVCALGLAAGPPPAVAAPLEQGGMRQAPGGTDRADGRRRACAVRSRRRMGQGQSAARPAAGRTALHRLEEQLSFRCGLAKLRVNLPETEEGGEQELDEKGNPVPPKAVPAGEAAARSARPKPSSRARPPAKTKDAKGLEGAAAACGGRQAQAEGTPEVKGRRPARRKPSRRPPRRRRNSGRRPTMPIGRRRAITLQAIRSRRRRPRSRTEAVTRLGAMPYRPQRTGGAWALV